MIRLPSRRALLAAPALLLTAAAAPAARRPPPESRPVLPAYPVVKPGAAIRFPQDHGAHPDYRTEWWYVTGWLRTPDGHDLGFQATFFRTRPAVDQRNPSAFAPKQILFAHAALSDPALRRLQHAQRIARQGFGLAETQIGDAHVVLDDWSFARDPRNVFHTHVAGDGFALDLNLAPTQPVILQGEAGYSRKGPRPEQASYYYSLPHLKVSGSVVRQGRRTPVTGEAWLDREWSSSLLEPGAVGWDWVGLNLDDGGALTVFQVRDARGRALWTSASIRGADGRVVLPKSSDVDLAVTRRWRSPRTGAVYPVERLLTLRQGGAMRRFHLRPLFDDQELDSRGAGGPVYWEGAVGGDGARGYLELTGYVEPLSI
jgi:predicted secreted hydrolase